MGAMLGYNTIICDTGSQLGIGEDSMSVSAGTAGGSDPQVLNQRLQRVCSSECLHSLHTKEPVRSIYQTQDSHSSV